MREKALFMSSFLLGGIAVLISSAVPEAVLAIPGTPDSSAYRDLNGMLKMKAPFKLWDDAFAKCEQEACEQFCGKALGLSEAKVEELIGHPFATEIEGRPLFVIRDSWNRQWLLIMGETPIFVRLGFHNNVCTDAFANPYDLDRNYCEWRAEEIRSSYAGKTTLEILAGEGPPWPLCLEATPPNQTGPEKLTWWQKRLSGQAAWTYHVGWGEEAKLIIKDGRCLATPGHSGVVLGSCNQRTKGASFKMPEVRNSIAQPHPVPVPTGGSMPPSLEPIAVQLHESSADAPTPVKIAPVIPQLGAASDMAPPSPKGVPRFAGSPAEAKQQQYPGPLDWGPYMADLQRRMDRCWYPPRKLKKDLSYTTKIAFSVHRDGFMTNLRVSQSSGNEAYDQKVLDAATTAAPWRPLPKRAPDDIDFEFVFGYKLNSKPWTQAIIDESRSESKQP